MRFHRSDLADCLSWKTRLLRCSAALTLIKVYIVESYSNHPFYFDFVHMFTVDIVRILPCTLSTIVCAINIVRKYIYMDSGFPHLLENLEK